MLERLCELAEARGVKRLKGTYVATEKNSVVRDLFARLGFTRLTGDEAASTWEYDLDLHGAIRSEFIGPWAEAVAGV